ncbi:unnamed protein product [Schistosoma margrebowiei]|uniref:Uncharacterized protein n=1 Tax=Schistosoma margrebowiei TaxID=48269 RepID=A0A183LPU8_9TREM|nr:unnamed protein product [Schistosoma margrebowiei]
MQESKISVSAASASVGINIHKGKSKVLQCNTTCNNRITHDGEDLEDLNTITYMSSIIDEHSGSDVDVKARIDTISNNLLWGRRNQKEALEVDTTQIEESTQLRQKPSHHFSSSRPKEKRKTKEYIYPRNGYRHEKNEQELDRSRKEEPEQSVLENAVWWPMLYSQNQLDDLDFADDLALLSCTHEQMQMKTASVAAVSASVGLSIHKGKAKVLKFKTKYSNPITLDGETLEDVNSFTYLGSIIDEQGGSDADVKVRIGKARTAFLQLKNIWNSKQLSTNIKVRIFNTNVKVVLLYGAET